jgi:hypothetical protein
MGWPNNFLAEQYTVKQPWSLLRKVLPFLSNIASWLSSSLLTTSGQRPFPTLPWRASTAYTVGTVRSNGGNLYVCTTAGTSAGSGGPTTTLDSIADNTVTWRFIRFDPLAWSASTAYVFGDMRSNQGQLYICTIAGTSAGSGGPTANNTAVVDNTVTWCRIQQQWIDSINGLDANDGLTPQAPKRSLPSALASNTHYWVFAGSTFNYDVALGNAVSVNATRISMTVVDRTNYNELTSQPNPFLRALVGDWYSQAEVSANYFSIVGNAPTYTDTAIGNSSGFTGTNGTTRFKLRGAYVYGFSYSGMTAQTGGYWDVSDCIIQSCKQIQTTESAGCGVRLEGASSNGNHIFTRLFISDSGEDAFWASQATNQAKDWTLSDCAIHHKPTLILSTSHGDALQFGSYPGSATIQRVIIEHDVSNIDYSDGTSPTGAAVIQDGTGTVGTEAWVISDCIFVSNNQVTNFQRASTGAGFGRCVFGLVGDVNLNALLRVHNANAAWSLTDCVNYIESINDNLRQMYSGNVPTKTNVIELTG